MSLLLLTWLSVMLPAGCSTMTPSESARIEPSLLGWDIPVYEAPVEIPRDGIPDSSPATDDPTGALSLREALVQALLKSPDLAAFSWEVRAGEARTLQASLLPNPELEVELEEFAGTNDFAGFDVATSKYRLSQLIETGGKRAKRTRLAALERDLNAWDYEARRLDVLTEATKVFVDVLAAQEQVALNTELVRLSEQSFETVSERVKAGKVSPLEETKSGVELANARIQLEQAQSTLEGARKRLAAVWGQQTATFDRAEGDLDALAPIPTADELRVRPKSLSRIAKSSQHETD